MGFAGLKTGHIMPMWK